MRSILMVLLALSAAPQPAAGGSYRLTSYEETVRLGENGDAKILLRLGIVREGGGDTLLLPFSSPVWPSVFAHSPAIDTLLPRKRNGHFQALVLFREIPAAGETLDVEYAVPGYSSLGKPPEEDFGNYTVAYRTVHSQPEPIERVLLRVLLPPGVVVNRVVSSTPAEKANSPHSPYLLGMEDGRHSVVLTAAPLLQGDALALVLEVKRRNGSPLLLAALGALALAYIIGFRDLVFPLRKKEGNHGPAL